MATPLAWKGNKSYGDWLVKHSSIVAVGGAVAAAIVAISIALRNESEYKSSIRPAKSAASTRTAQLERAALEPALAIAEIKPQSHISANNLAKARQLMKSHQPYPELIAMYQGGGPAAYSIVRDVVMECRSASQAVADAKAKGLLQGAAVPLVDQPAVQGGVETPQISAELHSRRVAAVQEIEGRCSSILSDTRLLEPHPGDAEGKRLFQLRKDAALDKDKVEQYLAELRSQGAPLTDGFVQQELLNRSIGQLYGLESAWQYQGLLALASYSLRLSESSHGDDIGSLSLCVSHGACDGRVESIPLDYFKIPRGSASHKRVIDLVPKMREILGG